MLSGRHYSSKQTHKHLRSSSKLSLPDILAAIRTFCMMTIGIATCDKSGEMYSSTVEATPFAYKVLSREKCKTKKYNTVFRLEGSRKMSSQTTYNHYTTMLIHATQIIVQSRKPWRLAKWHHRVMRVVHEVIFITFPVTHSDASQCT